MRGVDVGAGRELRGDADPAVGEQDVDARDAVRGEGEAGNRLRSGRLEAAECRTVAGRQSGQHTLEVGVVRSRAGAEGEEPVAARAAVIEAADEVKGVGGEGVAKGGMRRCPAVAEPA